MSYLRNDAVIFAGWCIVPSRFEVYIKDLLEHFQPNQIYVGLQPDNSDIAISILNHYGITNIAVARPELVLNSDASAFQAALALIKNKDFHIIHFLHTKGMSYRSDEQWQVSKYSYFNSYLQKMEKMNEQYVIPYIGGVGIVGEISPLLGESNYVKYVTDYGIPRRDSVTKVMWLTTHYGIRGCIIKSFLNDCSDRFFTERLNDRYYFESAFPLVVDMYGYMRHSFISWSGDAINIEETAWNQKYNTEKI